MKFITCILSVYIMVLTTIPCVDVPKDNTLNKTEITQNTTHNHQNGADHCSPFCTCDCCTCPVVFLDFIISTGSLPFSYKQQIIVYSSFYISTFSNSVWQPPKIG